MGMSTWQVVLLVVVFLPLIHVAVSGRSRGGAKAGWLLIVLFFSLLGYAVFLIVTQPSKAA